MRVPMYSNERDPDYIGDGVYVSWDGYQVWLRTERETGWQEIALEPSVLDALVRYQKRVIEQAERAAAGIS